MSWVERHIVIVTTDGDGNGLAHSSVLSGRIQQICYVKDANDPYAETVDFTITAEATEETIWSQTGVSVSTTVAPRQPTHTTAGVAALYAAGGTGVLDYIALSQDRVKIAVAQGGDSKTGIFYVIIV